MKIEPPEPPKDGFDFIDYPSDYDFKAVCRVDRQATIEPSEVIRELVLEHSVVGSIVAVKSKPSSAGKFESVTITVRLTSRQQLEAIYTSLSNSSLVVMTL